ncbi:MAG: hypothetical protein V4726_16060 [Verrucomicrobiota bacterium]
MKFPVITTAPALLLLFLPAFSSAQVIPHAHLRYLSIGKTGAATALAAAASSKDPGGHALFARLMTEVAEGKATLLADQEIIVRSGQRSKVAAVRHFPVPVDFTGPGTAGVILPTDFTTEGCGQTLEAELTISGALIPGVDRQLQDINLAPERKELLSLYPWPVPGLRGTGESGGGLPRLPLIAVQKTATQPLSWTGNTVLLSISPSPTTGLTDGEPMFCYQFIRSGLNGETPAPPDARRTGTEPGERRIHAVTLRLPRQEAAAVMLQTDGDDAALYARLSGMVTAGTATLSGHSAVVCRDGQRSKVESLVNFPVLDWSPQHPNFSYETRNIGEALEVETGGMTAHTTRTEDGRTQVIPVFENHNGVQSTWNIALERQSGLEMVPWHPAASKPDEAGALPEYLEQNLSAEFRIPPSGILCAGTISSSPATQSSEPDAASEGTTDITFVTQTPPPGTAEEGARPQVHLQAFMLSLPAADGVPLAAALKAASGAPLPAERWVQRLLRGEFPCAAQASTVVFPGRRSKMLGVRKVRLQETRPLTLPVTANRPSPVTTQSVSWEQNDCGVILTVEHGGAAADPVTDITWEWDTAPVLAPDEMDSPDAGLEARRYRQKIELRDLKLPRAQPVIADVRASNAREGAPEHGRWHALVLLAR